jgi:DNA-binding NarL/FixJ family response regulator
MPRARKLRMFLVEDSINMQLAMRELFDPMAGFDVIASARSEMAAIEWLLQHPNTWDVASLDLMLGDGSGYNLIRRCRAASPAAKIVVFSEYVTDVVRGHCVAIGADAAFNKSQIKEYAAYMDGLRDARMA